MGKFIFPEMKKKSRQSIFQALDDDKFILVAQIQSLLWKLWNIFDYYFLFEEISLKKHDVLGYTQILLLYPRTKLNMFYTLRQAWTTSGRRATYVRPAKHLSVAR